MPWELQTEAILGLLRTAIGPGEEIGGVPVEWASKPEGPIFLWLLTADEYPMVVLEPHTTDGEQLPLKTPVELVVDLYPVIQVSLAGSAGIAPTQYGTIRAVGERVVARVMQAGPHLDTQWLSRRFIRCGIEYDLCRTMESKGVLVYKATFGFRYIEAEV